jgi:hypothetical protein
MVNLPYVITSLRRLCLTMPELHTDHLGKEFVCCNQLRDLWCCERRIAWLGALSVVLIRPSQRLRSPTLWGLQSQTLSPTRKKDTFSESRWEMIPTHGDTCSTRLPSLPTRSTCIRRKNISYPQRRQPALSQFTRTLPYEYDNGFVSSSTSSGSSALDIISSVCSSSGSDSVTISTYSNQSATPSYGSTSTFEKYGDSVNCSSHVGITVPFIEQRSQSRRKTKSIPSLDQISHVEPSYRLTEPYTQISSNNITSRILTSNTKSASLSNGSHRGGSGRKQRTLDLNHRSTGRLLHNAGNTF